MFSTAFRFLLQQPIHKAVDVLKRGGLLAFPTETVYGLGVDASNEAALKRLYQVKGRPQNHPVIVHIYSENQLSQWAIDIPEAAYTLAEHFWPGPLTMILKKSAQVSLLVTGGQESIGLRVPNHELALALLKEFGGGIAAPSANKFGKISPTQAKHVKLDLGEEVDFILNGGPCQVGVESTIIDLTQTPPVILRPGMITQTQIETCLGYPIGNKEAGKTEKQVSGSLPSHYAPNTPVKLISPQALLEAVGACWVKKQKVGVMALSACPPPLNTKKFLQWVVLPQQPDAYARAMYTQLRYLDSKGLDVILVESVPDGLPWQAIQDRLTRAAFQEKVGTGASHVE